MKSLGSQVEIGNGKRKDRHRKGGGFLALSRLTEAGSKILSRTRHKFYASLSKRVTPCRRRFSRTLQAPLGAQRLLTSHIFGRITAVPSKFLRGQLPRLLTSR